MTAHPPALAPDAEARIREEAVYLHGECCQTCATDKGRDIEWCRAYLAVRDRLRALYSAGLAAGEQAGREKQKADDVAHVRAGADSLYAWMEKEPVQTALRKKLSVRAGERYEVARLLECVPPRRASDERARDAERGERGG